MTDSIEAERIEDANSGTLERIPSTSSTLTEVERVDLQSAVEVDLLQCESAPDLGPPASSSSEGWHKVGHGDFLASVDAACASPIIHGPAQHEDIIGVFLAKLERHNISEPDIEIVMTKLCKIQGWLEASEKDDREPQDTGGASAECLLEDPGVYNVDSASEWCYVDPPKDRVTGNSFWLVHREASEELLSQDDRLDFANLAVIEVLSEIVTAKWRDLLQQCITTEVSSPHCDMLRKVICIVDCFHQRIRPFFFAWYRTGDIIFYDLHARWRMGIGRPNLVLQLQKLYDAFSHSAIFFWDEGLPKVIHNLDSRFKVCSWKDCVYMAKREIDFHKVFAGFRFLPPDVQQQVGQLYERAVVTKAKESKSYVVESMPLFRGLRYLFTNRQYVANPPLIRRSAAGTTMDDQAPIEMPAPDGATQEPRRSPREYSEMMCAGFTAGFIFECLSEVQSSLPEWPAEMAFTSAFLIDLDHMTPKDLHQWDIWLDTGPPCPLHDILHPEVLANREKQPHMR